MKRSRILVLLLAGILMGGPIADADEEKGRNRIAAGEAVERARDVGIPFDGVPGPLNAITDVKGVLVGHTTLIEGDGDLVVGKGPIRTGVTAILPTGRKWRPVFAAWASLNGNGEMTGTHWIEESGYLEEPILLTNTHSVGAVNDAVIRWRAKAGYHGGTGRYAFASLPVVAETWDGRLNDIHGRHVKAKHVFAALRGARSGVVAEGNVGGGTGMVCHRFKSGIGTASRVINEAFHVGVLVQANYGERDGFTVSGVPVGKEIKDLMPEMHDAKPAGEGNSIIVVIATDAPLLPHQLKRLAARAPIGIARTGGYGTNSSGDLFLAFSTAPAVKENADAVTVRMIPNEAIDAYFLGVVQATEEAILNALVAARTMTGINGNVVHALPLDRLRDVLKQYNRFDGSRTPEPVR